METSPSVSKSSEASSNQPVSSSGFNQARCWPEAVTGPAIAIDIGTPRPIASSRSVQTRRRYPPPKLGNEPSRSRSRAGV